MCNLKPLSREAIPAAVEKAVRYRLLKEPSEAESICQDVLAIDPENQQALVVLLLALTDRFSQGAPACVSQAREVLSRLHSEYDRLYYAGLISERRAKAQLHTGSPEAAHAAFEWLEEAMSWYDKAEARRPEGNDDALLRWNACVRTIRQNNLGPRPVEEFQNSLE